MTDNECRPSVGRAPVIPSDEAGRRLQLALWSKAMGHAVRVHIVEILLKHDGCMCGDIVEHLDLAQSTISQHLKMLKESGIIQGTIDGSRMCYCVNLSVLKAMANGIGALSQDLPDSSAMSAGDCCPNP